MSDRCNAQPSGSQERCELPMHHDSPHMVSGTWGQMTWEPAYVGDLRRAVEDGAWRWRALLRNVLEDIGPHLNSDAISDARTELAKEEEAVT